MTTTEDGDGRVTSKRDDEHGCEFVHGARPAAGILHQAENEFREGQTSDVEAGGRAPKIDLSALSPPRSRSFAYWTALRFGFSTSWCYFWSSWTAPSSFPS
jgi:hypothetical protein